MGFRALLRGPWDLVTRLINKVTFTHNFLESLMAVLTRTHEGRRLSPRGLDP